MSSEMEVDVPEHIEEAGDTSSNPPLRHSPSDDYPMSPRLFDQINITNSEPLRRRKEPSPKFVEDRESCLKHFQSWNDQEQIEFVQNLLSQMCHYQHGQVNLYLKPMLQRDFLSLLPKKGCDHVAEMILSYLDDKSLRSAELVCKEWNRVAAEGMLWKKLIERNVRTDPLWRGLAERKGWIDYLFKPRPGQPMPDHSFYRRLYPQIIQSIDILDFNWRTGHHTLQRINCRSENSKGVYCLQYDDHKIVSGLRDNTIKIWDRNSLQCMQVLTGHTGSVLCLQYDDKVIISGSSDSTVRVWDVRNGELVNTLIHHCEAVLHLRFNDGMMVTCSKRQRHENFGAFQTVNGEYRSQLAAHLLLWDIETGSCLRILEGHEELVRCIRFDSKRIVSGAYD
ncbi:unnamed protein product, partial [Notodromas monacha]